jgi:hypothetical protein
MLFNRTAGASLPLILELNYCLVCEKQLEELSIPDLIIALLNTTAVNDIILPKPTVPLKMNVPGRLTFVLIFL